MAHPFLPNHVADLLEDPEKEPQEEEKEFEGEEFDEEMDMDMDFKEEITEPKKISPYEMMGPPRPPHVETYTHSNAETETAAATVGTITRLPPVIRRFTSKVFIRGGSSSTTPTTDNYVEFIPGLDPNLKDEIQYNNKLDQSVVMLKYRVISLEEEIEKLREKLKSAEVNDTSLRVDRDRAERDLIMPPRRMSQATIERLVADKVAKAITADRVIRNTTCGQGENNGEGGGQAGTPVVPECMVTGFMKCNPAIFHGTEGAVELC
uniref:Reverse transcriptase domain-containing protein n=1 Tax=Tanacetum cinerariifolium TaxID=118510 RepID=A0A6L2KFX0_TANCI|nr:hypothetical protein [Tanacetum cinerariifolium]